MAQLWYDVVPHNGGWAIVVTPANGGAYPTKYDAYDAAVDYARKLRFAGYEVKVRVRHDADRPVLKQAS